MKNKIICGNWKMNTNQEEAVNLSSEIEKNLPQIQTNLEVIICPPFVYLEAVKNVVSRLKLGAQNCYFEASGPFTGEISAFQLKDFCSYVILGHSERRKYLKETDEEISKKVNIVLESGLLAIVCVGETDQERESGREKEIVSRQVSKILEGLDADEASKLIFAYEPVWAIGTGKVCHVSQVVEAVKIIKEIIEKNFPGVSGNVPVLYGGSIKSSNVSEFAKEKNIDGVLVGGASLDAEDFIKIIKIYSNK